MVVAANLQIFMTNPASRCKGMWNLCVILALKNNLVRVNAAAPKHMLSLLTLNHMAAAFTLISICPSFEDLQRKRKSVQGNSLDFYSFNIEEGAC